jgi:hypothetical protein
MPSKKNNLNRMLTLIDEVFATKNDPDQIQVSPSQLKKLQQIHPSSLTEFANEDGPLIWLLIIPTTQIIMQQFLENKISEKQLLDLTPSEISYDAIYLCSVTTLPEIRNQGKTKALCLDAINAIKNNHNIKFLFVWPFTKAGEALAMSIANASSLKLLIK